MLEYIAGIQVARVREGHEAGGLSRSRSPEREDVNMRALKQLGDKRRAVSPRGSPARPTRSQAEREWRSRPTSQGYVPERKRTELEPRDVSPGRRSPGRHSPRQRSPSPSRRARSVSSAPEDIGVSRRKSKQTPRRQRQRPEQVMAYAEPLSPIISPVPSPKGRKKKLKTGADTGMFVDPDEQGIYRRKSTQVPRRPDPTVDVPVSIVPSSTAVPVVEVGQDGQRHVVYRDQTEPLMKGHVLHIPQRRVFSRIDPFVRVADVLGKAQETAAPEAPPATEPAATETQAPPATEPAATQAPPAPPEAPPAEPEVQPRPLPSPKPPLLPKSAEDDPEVRRMALEWSKGKSAPLSTDPRHADHLRRLRRADPAISLERFNAEQVERARADKVLRDAREKEEQAKRDEKERKEGLQTRMATIGTTTAPAPPPVPESDFLKDALNERRANLTALRDRTGRSVQDRGVEIEKEMQQPGFEKKGQEEWLAKHMRPAAEGHRLGGEPKVVMKGRIIPKSQRARFIISQNEERARARKSQDEERERARKSQEQVDTAVVAALENEVAEQDAAIVVATDEQKKLVDSAKEAVRVSSVANREVQDIQDSISPADEKYLRDYKQFTLARAEKRAYLARERA